MLTTSSEAESCTMERYRGVSRRLWFHRLLFAVLALLLVSRGIKTWGQAREEYAVEAAFLFHFAQLVDWPPEAEKSAEDSLSLCTIGEDPFQGALESTVGGKVVGSRTIRVRHLGEPQEMQTCQIVFISKSESKHVPALVAILHDSPTLTVGETPDFLDAGGMIRFVLEENKVRFDVNLNAAQSAHLKIGSRLLVLAEHVVGETHDK
jgi:hypothetical protein